MRVANRLQETGVHGLPQLATARFLADAVLGGIVAALQLRALERIGDRGGEAEVQVAARDEALDDGQDSARRAGGLGVAFEGANRWQHADIPAVGGGEVAESSGGACHRGGRFERLARLH